MIIHLTKSQIEALRSENISFNPERDYQEEEFDNLLDAIADVETGYANSDDLINADKFADIYDYIQSQNTNW